MYDWAKCVSNCNKSELWHVVSVLVACRGCWTHHVSPPPPPPVCPGLLPGSGYRPLLLPRQQLVAGRVPHPGVSAVRPHQVQGGGRSLSPNLSTVRELRQCGTGSSSRMDRSWERSSLMMTGRWYRMTECSLRRKSTRIWQYINFRLLPVEES